MGTPYYVHNKKNTYVRVDASSKELKMEIRDVDGSSLYKVEIKK